MAVVACPCVRAAGDGHGEHPKAPGIIGDCLWFVLSRPRGDVKGQAQQCSAAMSCRPTSRRCTSSSPIESRRKSTCGIAQRRDECLMGLLGSSSRTSQPTTEYPPRVWHGHFLSQCRLAATARCVCESVGRCECSSSRSSASCCRQSFSHANSCIRPGSPRKADAQSKPRGVHRRFCGAPFWLRRPPRANFRRADLTVAKLHFSRKPHVQPGLGLSSGDSMRHCQNCGPCLRPLQWWRCNDRSLRA